MGIVSCFHPGAADRLYKAVSIPLIQQCVIRAGFIISPGSGSFSLPLHLLKRVLWHENYAALTSLAAILGHVCVFWLQSNDDPLRSATICYRGVPRSICKTRMLGKMACEPLQPASIELTAGPLEEGTLQACSLHLWSDAWKTRVEGQWKK